MWELDCEEGWSPKNWCFWTVVLEKTLESPLDCKEIKPVNPKGNQSWIFIGLMLKLKLQYFHHLMQKADSLKKTLMLGGIGSRRRRWQRMRWLDGITDSMHMKVKVKSLSRVWLLATPWTAAYQASPSMGFSRQEYWSGLPFLANNVSDFEYAI